MKRLLVGTAAACLVAYAALAAAGRPAVAQGQILEAATEPWQVGRCYRVFPPERDQLYVFRVLEPPAGSYVRVESDPAGIRVPGARPAAPLWLNTASPFAIQEWPCSRR